MLATMYTSGMFSAFCQNPNLWVDLLVNNRNVILWLD